MYCGEDTVASREAFIRALKDKENKGEMVETLNEYELIERLQLEFSELNMFSATVAYATDSLIKKSRRIKKLKDVIAQALQAPYLTIFTWEEASARDLGALKGAVVKESKPKGNIFTLLDAFTPGNKRVFIEQLQTLTDYQDIHIVTTMLVRHIHILLSIKRGEADPKLQPWQLSKLKRQAGAWEEAGLMRILEAIITLEKNEKTSSSPLTLQEQLTMLICFAL